MSYLGASVDIIHAIAMIAWGLGLPLLFWHRWPKLTIAYIWYAIAFVVISQVSHYFLNECWLTTLARELNQAGDVRISFTVRFVNFIAGIRPTEDWVVRVWEGAMVTTCVAVLWAMYKKDGRQQTSKAT